MKARVNNAKALFIITAIFSLLFSSAVFADDISMDNELADAGLMGASISNGGKSEQGSFSVSRYDEDKHIYITDSYDWEITGTDGDLTLSVTNGQGEFTLSSNRYADALPGRLYDNKTGRWSSKAVYDIQHIIIGEGITKISTRNLDDERSRSNIQTLSLPASLEDIFTDWGRRENFEEITVAGNSPNYKIVNHSLVDTRSNTLVLYPGGRKETTYSIPEGIRMLECGVFACNNNLTEVHIPDSVLAIEECCFMDSPFIKEIHIPKSVMVIGDLDLSLAGKEDEETLRGWFGDGALDAVFNGCDSLTSITVDDDNSYFSSIDGVLFNKNKNILYVYPEGRDDTDHIYTIPSGVTRIVDYVFADTKLIKGVVYGKGMYNQGSPFGHKDEPETSVTDIYFEGNEEEWNAIWPDPYSDYDYLPTVHYNYVKSDPDEKKEEEKKEEENNQTEKDKLEENTNTVSASYGGYTATISMNKAVPFTKKKKEVVSHLNIRLEVKKEDGTSAGISVKKVKSTKPKHGSAKVTIKLKGGSREEKKAVKKLNKQLKKIAVTVESQGTEAVAKN